MRGAAFLGLSVMALAGALFSQGGQQRITYANRIHQMFDEKCVSCHYSGGSAPFDFSTYEGIRSRSELIRVQALSRNMPPVWIHSDHGKWANVEPMSDQDLVDLQMWLNNKMPEGDLTGPYAVIRERKWTNSTITVSPKSKVRAEGIPYWRVESVPLPASGGSFRAFSLQPNNSRVIRSATLAIVPKDMKLPKETVGSMDIDGKYLVGVWAPGYRSWSLPNGMTRKFPPNSKLVVQVQYRPSGKEEDGGFRVRLDPSTTPKPTEPKWISLEKKPLFIDAGAAFALDLTYTVDRDINLISILPEARFYAGKIELLSVKPGEKPTTIFEDRRWDPYWIGNFMPQAPIRISKGTTLIARFHYNNDENCRINQGRPLLPVKNGPTASDEVCRMHLLVGP